MKSSNVLLLILDHQLDGVSQGVNHAPKHGILVVHHGQYLVKVLQYHRQFHMLRCGLCTFEDAADVQILIQYQCTIW